MTDRAARVLVEALNLPAEERGELAARLIESLDAGADADSAAAWEAEIQLRLEQLRTGEAKAIPWPEARRLILEDGNEPGEA
jgi:putative addiction module component (TIGR02574 family)